MHTQREERFHNMSKIAISERYIMSKFCRVFFFNYFIYFPISFKGHIV